MLFGRQFTKPGASPYDGVTWTKRKSSPAAGSRDAIVPDGWSQTAVDIIVGKYFRKAGVPALLNPHQSEQDKELNVPDWLLPRRPRDGTTFGSETDARQVFDRLAGFWAYWGWKLGYFAHPHEKADYRHAPFGAAARKLAEEQAAAFYDELRHMLARQMAAPASPQWFNAGLAWAYGTSGDDCGQWAVQWIKYEAGSLHGADPKTTPAGWGVERSENPYLRPALSACFIQSVKDNLVEGGGIQDLMRREALVFKYGGGSGTNWSPVRGAGEKLSGGGASSGLLSFLQAPDKSAGAIKSGGTTRRAARMLCLDDDHPELMEFTTWKATEEKKVAAMAAGAELVNREVNRVYRLAAEYRDAPAKDVGDDASPRPPSAAKRLKRARGVAVRMGVPKSILDAAEIAGASGERCPVVPLLPPDFEGESYATVGGQNANNSVRVSNDFLFAAEEGREWHLYGRLEKAAAKTDGRAPKPLKTVLASDALKAQAYAAWECGCPGWQYDTTINEWWTCPADGKVNASNPCSEYMAADDTACNLASLNLLAFFAGRAFDVSSFEHATRLWTVVLDITVTAAGYPSEEIARGSWNYRTLGLGYTNLGAVLMRLGIPYDSDEGRAWAGYLTALEHYAAAIASAEMAAALSPFPRYAANKDGVARVMRNHAVFGTTGATKGEYVKLTWKPEPLWSRPGAAAVPAELRQRVNDQAHTMVAVTTRDGMRNAQLTLVAPNGTIGLLMDSDTTGVEPDFALVKWKKLAGGGFLKIVNQSIPAALDALGYTLEQREEIVRWVVGKGS
jgi:ribonucleoside-diphosphate reductase alpha chain